MTFSLHAFTASDTSFDVQAAALEDVRPHPTEDALVQLGHALMTELIDLVGDTALEDVQAILAESLIGAFHSAAGRIEREAERGRDRMRWLERDFDGSEMADTELQEATRATRAYDVAQCMATVPGGLSCTSLRVGRRPNFARNCWHSWLSMKLAASRAVLGLGALAFTATWPKISATGSSANTSMP